MNPKNLHLNMQYYMEYCKTNGYVTPQEWLEKYKHYNDEKEPIIYTEEEVKDLLNRLFFGQIVPDYTATWEQEDMENWFNKNKKNKN